MGDCRIRIQISKNCDVGRLDDNNIDSLIPVSAKLWSADTTIYEVFELTTIKPSVGAAVGASSTTLLSLVRSGSVSVWDCTTFPSQNITEICRNLDLCRIKTLFALGWFPSGSLQFLPIDSVGPLSASPDLYDDFQYNHKGIVFEKRSSSSAVNQVQLVQVEGAARASDPCVVADRMLPSHVLHQVTERFNDDENEQEALAFKIRQDNHKRKKEAEFLRNSKLDEQIRKLESTKHQPVSDQVRKMLIKSRATGRVNIQPQDRVYLHCLLLDDDEGLDPSITGNESYRYFSIQDTVGHAIDALIVHPKSFTSPKANPSQRKEMLVKVTRDGSNEYRRLPYALRFYEAIAQSLLVKDVNTIIIRSSAHDDTTTEVDHDVDSASTLDTTDTNVRDSLVIATNDFNDGAGNESMLKITTTLFPFVSDLTCSHLRDTLQTILPFPDKSYAKRSALAKEKVRQMQMKSKARGDVKRIKLPEQRFFLQFVTVVENHDNNVESNSHLQIIGDDPIFLSRLDPLHRLVRDFSPGIPKHDASQPLFWELLVFVCNRTINGDQEFESNFRRIMTSDDTNEEKQSKMTWSDAERNGIVRCFDSVILRYVCHMPPTIK
jgi:hypothetical protein